jgi:hemerythrin-like metal-binding protein
MLNWQDQEHALGVPEMDDTHREFVQLANAVATAGDDDFVTHFDALVEHTRHHFENEGRLMRACRFPAIGEHENEHRRVLGELAAMRSAAMRGRLSIARAYIGQGVPDWFRNHLATMDSALAAKLRER